MKAEEITRPVSEIDYFALLDEPRRPWIDPDSLKKKFLEFSARLHPDRLHQANEADKQAAQQRYTQLNAAYNCLRDPKDRLRHLLKLLGTELDGIQQIPPDLMDVYMEVSRICRNADSLLAEKAKATSPLLQVQMFQRSQALADEVRAFQQGLTSRREKLIAELQQIDAIWHLPADDRSPGQSESLRRLEVLCLLFGFFDRWSAQLQERITQLSF